MDFVMLTREKVRCILWECQRFDEAEAEELSMVSICFKDRIRVELVNYCGRVGKLAPEGTVFLGIRIMYFVL